MHVFFDDHTKSPEDAQREEAIRRKTAIEQALRNSLSGEQLLHAILLCDHEFPIDQPFSATTFCQRLVETIPDLHLSHRARWQLLNLLRQSAQALGIGPLTSSSGIRRELLQASPQAQVTCLPGGAETALAAPGATAPLNAAAVIERTVDEGLQVGCLPSSLHHIVYVSAATRYMSHDDILALLHKSQAANAKVGVTGMLLYKDGDFMQVLEGERAVIEPIYAKIQRDPRHTRVTCLIDRPVATRMFPTWSMGYKHLTTEEAARHPGLTDFMRSGVMPGAKISLHEAYKLLATFRAT